MNPQTTTTTENTVPQWAKDAADQWAKDAADHYWQQEGPGSLAEIIVKHAPQHWSVQEMASQIQQRDAMRQERDTALAELEALKAKFIPRE